MNSSICDTNTLFLSIILMLTIILMAIVFLSIASTISYANFLTRFYILKFGSNIIQLSNSQKLQKANAQINFSSSIWLGIEFSIEFFFVRLCNSSIYFGAGYWQATSIRANQCKQWNWGEYHFYYVEQIWKGKKERRRGGGRRKHLFLLNFDFSS